MCLLIVLRGFDASHPLLVAANRDERRDRRAAPPGLFVGERRRMLSPRDREAGGTWLAIDDGGRFAGITNLAGVPAVPGAPSRGHLPHAALDAADLDAGLATVRERITRERHAGFQLVLADHERIVVLRHHDGVVQTFDWNEPVLVVSNEHGPGELTLRGVAPALSPRLAVERRLDLLAAVLRDPGGAGQHPVLKRGAAYGTVSSSLLAVPSGDPRALTWRYAAGSPDTTPYANYGNLGRRLLPEHD